MQDGHVHARQSAKKMLGLLAAGVCLWGAVGPATAQGQKAEEMVERVGSGQINWTTGWITATGVGVPPVTGGPGARVQAERAGYVVALRNLLEIVKGVRVDAESITDAYLVKNQVIRTQVSGYIQGAQVVKTDLQPDGSVTVTVKMPVWGNDSLITALIGEKAAQSQKLLPESQTLEGYTGLVIDGRGLGVQPACFPEILDEGGKVVYGPEMVDRASAEKDGMVRYLTLAKGTTLSSVFGEEAYVIRPVQGPQAPKAGRRPLKIKGVNSAGSLKANVIISHEDAKKIREDAQIGGALKRSKVIIVTDPLVGGMEGRAPYLRLVGVGNPPHP